MSDESELLALERNLTEATTAFKDAEQREALARRDATDARNVLDAAQRQLDAYIAKLREGAPLNSDWGNTKRHRFAVKAPA